MARKLFGFIAAVALASGAMFALVGPASAGQQNTLTVTKHVVGAVPSGTVFSVQVNCTTAGLQTVWFDDTGHASNSVGTQITAPILHPSISDTCTVTETHSGGASSVTYHCTDGGDRATCQTGDQTIIYLDTTNGTANVDVTNTFNETTTTTTRPATTTTTPATTTTTLAPKPAPKPVVAAANFTG